MQISETLYLTDRVKWRRWLKKNHKLKKEIWLVYYKKRSGQPRIPYDHAVEEALCFGWIDTTVQRIDEDRYAQKFTPRRPNSKWSETNIRRVKKMIRARKMTRAGLVVFDKADKNMEIAEKSKSRLLIPPDLKKALSGDSAAEKNFAKFAPGYRRDYVNWIKAAKREETRQRRIAAVVERAASNIKPGML